MPQPAKPAGIDEGIVKGLYRFNTAESAGLDLPANSSRIQLLSSGTAIHWALEAQKLLAAEWGVAADVWSATSWTELRRDALEADAALLRGE
ncbi:transketolase-like TK C-terminal-containing protein, partial [Streptomyces cinereoruber]